MAAWLGKPFPLAHIKGGAKAVADTFDNLVRTGVSAWPPPEIAISGLGCSCYAQSLHSEDAIT